MIIRWKIRWAVFLAAGLVLSAMPAQAQSPKIQQLRTQKIDKTIFFQVRIERPADLRTVNDRGRFAGWRDDRTFDLLPRLVPQDGHTKAVYLSGRSVEVLANLPNFPPRVIEPDEAPAPLPPSEKRTEQAPPAEKCIAQPPPADKGPASNALEFVGKVQGGGPAKLLLLYPKDTGPAPKEKQSLAQLLQRRNTWAEVEVTLDFAKADKIPPPAIKRKAPVVPLGPRDGAAPAAPIPPRAGGQPALPAPQRVDRQPIDNNDLEGLWALGQMTCFTVLAAQTPEFGFYPFARETTSKKYSVAQPPQFQRWDRWDRRGSDTGRLYEITTGAAAITESLALNRLRDPKFRAKDEIRSIDINKVQGIDIAEHPWVKMMAGQKPSPEPLAKLVPDDNYYIHFKNIAKFLETGDLLDQWGTSLARALEANSRDFAIKERYEQQLCLKSTQLTRILGPTVVKSLALTGNDPYLREGSDLTIIFHLANKNFFLASAEPHLKEARTKFAGRLKEDKQQHLDVTVESYVTPLREVSLHRAMFGEYMVYSNSPVGIRRVIDTFKGKRAALADSLDYQYMRTVFRLEDPLEDGFVFLSDKFIRALVGPATRIKERRRLEALTSLSMVANGALFQAWETGKLPNSHQDLMAYTGLTPDLIFSPDGDAAIWSPDQKIAVSTFYNTQNFATPLIEIPITFVTPSEQREYEEFRLRYLGLWRQFFDPIGIRIGLNNTNKEVRWETYILPLVRSTEYNRLRAFAGDGTMKLNPGMFNDKTILQFMSHISPNAPERKELGLFLGAFSRDIPGLNWLGDWFTVRVDDSPVYGQLLEREIMHELGLVEGVNFDEEMRLVFQMPITLGVDIRNPLVFAGVLAAAKKAISDALPGAVEWEPLKEPYKGTTIVEIKAKVEARFFGAKEPLTPSLYYALVDGAWYISFKQSCIHDEIDRSIARKQAKTQPATIDVNTSLYVSPKAAVHTKEFLQFYFEWETHRRALTNTNLLYPLYRGGIISAADDGATVQAAALKFLGFVPVSPDYAAYSYDRKTDEVVNKRHGSPRQPQLQKTLDANSPIAQILEQFPSLRADLRFREDGLHTVVTFKRK